MGRHISFWIGFFAAALLVVPIALYSWGLAQERLFDLLAMVFGGLVVLVVLLIVVLLFRAPLLRKVLGRSEASVDEITRSLVAGVSAAATGDVKRAEAEADTLARVAIGWYAWSNFYRWVIGTCVALMLAFATFTGTVLLFEQTKKIGLQTEVMLSQKLAMDAQTQRMEEQTLQAQMQNELAAVSFVTELHARLLDATSQTSVVDVLNKTILFAVGARDENFVGLTAECSLSIDVEQKLNTAASEAALLLLEDQAKDGLVSERARRALEYLVRDINSAVALSALIVLDRLGMTLKGVEIKLDGVAIDRLSLSQSHVLRIENSVVSSLDCPKCALYLNGSVLEDISARQVSGSANVFGDFPRSAGLYGIIVREWNDEIPKDLDNSLLRLETGGLIGHMGHEAYMRVVKDNTVCGGLSDIGRRSRIFKVPGDDSNFSEFR